MCLRSDRACAQVRSTLFSLGTTQFLGPSIPIWWLDPRQEQQLNFISGEITMIAYTMLGTNDLDRAGKFYDALFGELAASRAMETDRMIAWATGPGQPMFSVVKPLDEKPATVGNGVMIALGASNPAAVDALHAKAMQLGGKDEGAPGVRGDMFYIAYCRDLDGNKINFFCPKDA
jgi:predicted lactoylglutathione lyase